MSCFAEKGSKCEAEEGIEAPEIIADGGRPETMQHWETAPVYCI